MSTASSIAIKLDTPVQVKGEGTLDISYFVYPITLTLPSVGSDMRVSRRYTDFAALRSQLVASYWACIVPPIPAKESVQDKLSKINSAHAKESEQALLEYRRVALRRFLQRVAHHPVLGRSSLFIKFTNDNEWRQCLRDPVKMPVFLSTSLTDGLVKSLTVGTTATSPRDGATAFQLALTEERPDAAAWASTAAYISQLRNSLNTLRTRFQSLVTRRRTVGEALQDFGEVFGSLGNEEEDNDLHEATQAIRVRSKSVSDIYGKQAEQEATKVVSALSFYVGMCAAVEESIQHVQSYMHELEATTRRVNELEGSIPSAAPANRNAMHTTLHNLQETRRRMEQEFLEGERTFRAEFVKFHHDKQYDMKELLKVFGNMQLQYAANMSKEWDMLRPMVENLSH